MKKCIALLLASLVMLTGCSAPNGATADPTPTQAPAAIDTKDMDFTFTDRELAGTWEVQILKDRWTTVTADGKLSAHYENTVLITDGEPEILTVAEGL